MALSRGVTDWQWQHHPWGHFHVTESGQFFPISFDSRGLDRATKFLDTALGGGPGRSGVWVLPERLGIRMSTFTLDVPRSSVRSVASSGEDLHGTTGVHIGRGRALINGCARGLVEIKLDPPLRTGRSMSSGFLRQVVTSIFLSMEDPDAFIAAASSDGNVEAAE
jgi:hypothetical protein